MSKFVSCLNYIGQTILLSYFIMLAHNTEIFFEKLTKFVKKKFNLKISQNLGKKLMKY
jgi:hypothetical protein